MQLLKNFYLLPVILLIFCCQKDHSLSMEEFQEYIRDPKNGLYKSTKVGDVQYVLQYRPTDLMIANDIKKETDSLKIKAARAKYSKYHYFVLSISKNGKDILRQVSNNQQYNELLQVFSFQMQDYISLTVKQDTFKMQDYIYQNNYGLSKSSTFLLAFSKEITSKSDTLSIDIADLGIGAGDQVYEFNLKDINTIPSIKY